MPARTRPDHVEPNPAEFSIDPVRDPSIRPELAKPQSIKLDGLDDAFEHYGWELFPTDERLLSWWFELMDTFPGQVVLYTYGDSTHGRPLIAARISPKRGIGKLTTNRLWVGRPHNDERASDTGLIGTARWLLERGVLDSIDAYVDIIIDADPDGSALVGEHGDDALEQLMAIHRGRFIERPGGFISHDIETSGVHERDLIDCRSVPRIIHAETKELTALLDLAEKPGVEPDSIVMCHTHNMSPGSYIGSSYGNRVEFAPSLHAVLAVNSDDVPMLGWDQDWDKECVLPGVFPYPGRYVGRASHGVSGSTTVITTGGRLSETTPTLLLDLPIRMPTRRAPAYATARTVKDVAAVSARELQKFRATLPDLTPFLAMLKCRAADATDPKARLFMNAAAAIEHPDHWPPPLRCFIDRKPDLELVFRFGGVPLLVELRRKQEVARALAFAGEFSAATEVAQLTKQGFASFLEDWKVENTDRRQMFGTFARTLLISLGGRDLSRSPFDMPEERKIAERVNEQFGRDFRETVPYSRRIGVLRSLQMSGVGARVAG
jgi:hypothetical protein